MSKAGMLVESHADMLDRMFWSELPEHSKKQALLSEDAACVPARNVRQYVELLLEREDRETATVVLKTMPARLIPQNPSTAEKRRRACTTCGLASHRWRERTRRNHAEAGRCADKRI